MQLKREVQQARRPESADDFRPIAAGLVLLVMIAGFTGWLAGETRGYDQGYASAKWIFEPADGPTCQAPHYVLDNAPLYYTAPLILNVSGE